MDRALKKICFLTGNTARHTEVTQIAAQMRDMLDKERIAFDIKNIFTETDCAGVCSAEGTLAVTAESAVCAAVGEKIPLLGILTEKNISEPFTKVRYVAVWPCEAEYMERVYRRLRALPWKIAETERLLLRETVEEDIDAFYRLYEEAQAARYMEPLFEKKEEELAYLERYRKNMYEFYEYGIWTVVLKETGEVIGRAGLDMREGFSIPELGFMIGAPWQKKGLGREACEAVLNYAAEELELTSVQAFVNPQNTASLHLLHALGFREDDACEEGNTKKGACGICCLILKIIP